MIDVSKEERQAALFLKASAGVYLVLGLAFIVAPDLILSLFNRVSEHLFPSLPLTPTGGEHFWTALAFSMMMTITAICYAAQHNIRRNKHLVIILLVSKGASSLAGLGLFLFQQRYFSYPGIALVDGTIFWITLVFYLRANKAFSQKQAVMIRVSKEEKQAALFLKASAGVYLVVGLAFIIAPDRILWLFNLVSEHLLPSLPLTPTGGEHFWTALAFSMMMTITAICYAAQHNIRRNKHLAIILLVCKSASSLSGLGLFLFQQHYFSYLGIALVDGTIFWITLVFYLRANKAFFQEQTFYEHKPPAVIKTTPPTKVVVRSGECKFVLLDQVVTESGFWDVLGREFAASGKSKPDFRVVIKPNFMFMHSRRDVSSYTDPELVEDLVDRIVARGFTNVTLVEAQSTYGNYYKNREVLKVAEYVGYSTKKNYRIVDLTEEMVPFDYGGRLGKHFVGPTWRDADFRVSFAKNKTHVFCNYTLTLKNIFGTLPIQNKLKEYHAKREYDWPTIESMKHFPVHFGLIDAIVSADGQFGVVVDPHPNDTKTMLAGENLMAVDWVAAKKMGLNPDAPDVGRFLPLAFEAFGRPERIDWIGDKSVYHPWTNVRDGLIKALDLIEEAEVFANWWCGCVTAMDPYFKYKLNALPGLLMRKLLAPVKRLLFRYDDLSR